MSNQTEVKPGQRWRWNHKDNPDKFVAWLSQMLDYRLVSPASPESKPAAPTAEQKAPKVVRPWKQDRERLAKTVVSVVTRDADRQWREYSPSRADLIAELADPWKPGDSAIAASRGAPPQTWRKR